MAHIVWDWNGTLFHDIHAVVRVTNDIFARYGVSPLTVDGFRAVFGRPIRLCYQRILGRELAPGEWERIDAEFHHRYLDVMAGCALTPGAPTLLEAWRGGGGSQSLLSMWRHEKLVEAVAEFGIASAFTRVDGSRGVGADSKAGPLAAHLRAQRLDPAEVVVIGDSVDDAEAARSVGAAAVLYTGGCHARPTLEATGFPVVDRLEDALSHVTGGPAMGGTPRDVPPALGTGRSGDGVRDMTPG